MQRRELKVFAAIVGVFAICYYLPVGTARFNNAVMESLYLVREYAREHVLLCLVPAFFIAGAIGAFINKQAVLKYLGAEAKKVVAYSVASVSGAVLAVCSCTVLPLFAGIYRMGAGIGPATAFLYAGPAINVLAIILTARILGWQLGVARAVGAVVFAVVIGLLMQFIFRNEEKVTPAKRDVADDQAGRSLWQNALVLVAMVVFLVFANWSVSGQLTVGVACCPNGVRIEDYVEGKLVSDSADEVTIELPDGTIKTYPRNLVNSVTRLESPWYLMIHRARFFIAFVAFALLLSLLYLWFKKSELKEWGDITWDFAKQILPLLFIGVLIAGFLLGRPGNEGIIPARFVQMLVGASPDTLLQQTGIEGSLAGVIRVVWPLWTNLFASVVGAFMYFATLTEVPIVEGLRGAGMADGPALALLLAGPALSLPNMLVIRSVLGTKKTVVYILLVVTMATISGLLFGFFVG